MGPPPRPPHRGANTPRLGIRNRSRFSGVISDTPVEGRPLDDESALVEDARRGVPGAYEELVHRHQSLAVRTAYLITGESTEAEDATQAAFVKAFGALDRFRSGMPFRPWLLKIVTNEARNKRRSAGRRTGLELRLAGQPVRDDAAPSPEAAALAADDRRSLVAALNGLREEDRLAIAYRYFLEMSEEEIATALGCARGTVKSRLSRALVKLRRELELDRESTHG